jgi:hypothetical protein
MGAGALLHLSDRMDMRIGATLHFTMTDYIDGVTENSKGIRKGDSKNDSYMMTSFSLRYDLFNNKESATDSLGQDYFDNSEIYVLDKEDADGDGVLDIVDKCLGTPPGISVDANGCPQDDDKDGIPNSEDDELQSPPGSVVDDKGVALSDSLIALRYDMYLDSTGKYSKTVVLESENKNQYIAANNSKKKYSVKLGEYTTGVPSDMMTKFLSIPDIESGPVNDSTTIYTAGKYATQEEADKRKDELIKAGITGAVVVYKQNDKYVDPSTVVAINSGNKGNEGNQGNKGNDGSNGNQGSNGQSAGTTTPSNGEVVFRIQLGAYKHKISKNVFGGNDVVEVKTDDGLYKYLTGTYKTFDEAAKRKVDMLLKGFPDAFIVAYKDGKRVPLTTVGATQVKKETENLEDLHKPMSTANKDLVVFKVQIGVFRNEPPADMQAKFNKMKDIQKQTTTTGLTRYSVGSFKDYNAAVKLKNEMKEKYGIDDAFVVAFFKDQYISLQEALELIK